MTLLARITRMIRDLLLVAVGVLAVLQTPPSIEYVGLHGLLSNIWAAMIGGGALAALYGVVRDRVGVEIYGCCFVGGGFLVWSVAALTQPGANLTSLLIALVFLAGTAGQAYRVGTLAAEGRVRG